MNRQPRRSSIFCGKPMTATNTGPKLEEVTSIGFEFSVFVSITAQCLPMQQQRQQAQRRVRARPYYSSHDGEKTEHPATHGPPIATIRNLPLSRGIVFGRGAAIRTFIVHRGTQVAADYIVGLHRLQPFYVFHGVTTK